ncbi:PRMT1 [Branchiostoma lanceolatum]|uniref:type I protein arginine methyltransferase n=1 Tax=Branchiostoma lanceolatum TaxID=7740 RepID=A0A8J9YU83_BRALA|nr:PRMT1 [Branchiostoma lanceolatum]
MVKVNGNDALANGNHEEIFKEDGISAYARPDLHQGLLEDKTRTVFYKNTILKNKDLFEGKIVLDISCGLGMMSLFAAKAGARKVIGVEQSAVADQAMDIVKDNGLENVITIVKGKPDEIELAGEEKVDIIISEIMGVGLIHETGIRSLLDARNRFLKPGGLLLPDKNNLYICGVEATKLHERHIGYWNDVYGFDFSEMGKHAKSYAWHVPLKGRQVVTEPTLLKEYDWSTCADGDIFFSTPFTLKCKKSDKIHSLAIYFDIQFNNSDILSTGPEADSTHWGQLAFHLDQALDVKEGDEIQGTFSVKPHGEWDLEFQLKIDYKETSFTKAYYHYCPVSPNGSHLMYTTDE